MKEKIKNGLSRFFLPQAALWSALHITTLWDAPQELVR